MNEPKPSRREALRTRKRRPSRITIPKHVSPHVALVFAEMKRQNVVYDDVEERAGVLRTTLKSWRHRSAPGITNLAAVLGSLGWDFVPIPRARVLPKALVADLEVVAKAHGLETSATIEALIAHVTRWRGHAPAAPSTAPSLDDMAPIGGTDMAAA